MKQAIAGQLFLKVQHISRRPVRKRETVVELLRVWNQTDRLFQLSYLARVIPLLLVHEG